MRLFGLNTHGVHVLRRLSAERCDTLFGRVELARVVNWANAHMTEVNAIALHAR